MTINLSPEIEAKAARIPDFAQRLERFVNDQYAVEQWRIHRLQTVLNGSEAGTGLIYQDGHWAATGELPVGFDFGRFIEEVQEARIHEVAGL